MSATTVTIASGAARLETLIQRGQGCEAVVICHPHPLYGGSMDNNVVAALAELCTSLGWTTVRFNFRGVGASTGAYGDGEGETEDLASVVAHVRREERCRIHLAGYSFGAWVVLNALKQGIQASSVMLASPPVDFMDFRELPLPECPTLIVLGDSDPFCAVPSLEAWLASRPDRPVPPRVVILPRCDHFYWGFESRLAREAAAFVRDLPGPGDSGRSDGPDR